jgi:hypothetical protein
MTPFTCDACGATVYFDNDRCLRCGHALAFVPGECRVAALEPTDDRRWRLATDAPRLRDRRYKVCRHAGTSSLACNWLLDAEDPLDLCCACRLTSQIADLAQPDQRARVARLEKAKRRLLIDLRQLRLPVFHSETRHPLRFAFLADLPGQSPVLTGHADGLITVNLKEADDVARTRARQNLAEPYRTVLGHLRHEVGHYYWDEFFLDAPEDLAACRALFGDERADYAQALQTHYEAPRADWADTFVSQYASAHPWEDWAETWAHALHLHALLDAVAGFAPALLPQPVTAGRPWDDIDAALDHAQRLTPIVNELNRSLGQADAYPFVIAPAVRDKLRFVHRMIRAHAVLS